MCACMTSTGLHVCISYVCKNNLSVIKVASHFDDRHTYILLPKMTSLVTFKKDVFIFIVEVNDDYELI